MPVLLIAAGTERSFLRVEPGGLVQGPFADVDVGELVDGGQVPAELEGVYLVIAVQVAVTQEAGVDGLVVTAIEARALGLVGAIATFKVRG